LGFFFKEDKYDEDVRSGNCHKNDSMISK
jgi:hypothetical protein